MSSIQFKGKSLVETLHLTIPYRQLAPDAAASLAERPGLDGNLIIHGDNLLALKSLLPSFGGKIKCIYIDPPYNTGNEGWVYNDNVNSQMHQEWLHKEVGRDDLTRHDKWLCMMYPRLRLLRELLREDGVICVSIDDNEAHRLRMLMDEVFGEENYRNTIIVRRYDKNINLQFVAGGLQTMHVGVEYALLYGRSEAFVMNPVYRGASEQRQRSGYWKGFWNAADRPTMRYELLGVTPQEGQWKWQPAVALAAVHNYDVYLRDAAATTSLEDYWEQTGRALKFIRRNPQGRGKNEGVEHWVPPSSGILRNSNWTDLLASGALDTLGLAFDSPKSVELIGEILRLCTCDGDIVLDSFAGSGTTGHAVLALNAEDGGSRRFILVEQEAYAETLTAERLRRAIAGVAGARDEALRRGYGGSFSFFRLGEAIDEDELLSGRALPPYRELARYVFFTATGETIDETRIDEERQFIGHSSRYEVYLIYRPDVQYLKTTPLTLAWARQLGPAGAKARLVFAPFKLLDNDVLRAMRIEYCQLPFGIYRFRA